MAWVGSAGVGRQRKQAVRQSAMQWWHDRIRAWAHSGRCKMEAAHISVSTSAYGDWIKYGALAVLDKETR